MGQFSWFTQDTNHRIVNGEEYSVIMTDDKGTKYAEIGMKDMEFLAERIITSFLLK